MHFRLWIVWGSLGLAVATLGCAGRGKGWTAVYPVRGTVAYKGQPVSDATVTFYPVDKGDGQKVPGAYARTDAQGRFSLTTFKEGDGAAPGEFVVMVAKDIDESPPTEEKMRDPKRKPQFKAYLPKFLATVSRTPLRVNVQASSNNFVINLADGSKECTIK